MCDEQICVEVPFSMFTEPQLVGLRAATGHWAAPAQALAVCIGTACAMELARREWNRTNDEPEAAGQLTIDFGRWSDRDVGEALRLLAAFSKAATMPEFGEMVDQLLDVLANVSYMRLCGTNDARNAEPFTTRLGDYNSGNAETN